MYIKNSNMAFVFSPIEDLKKIFYTHNDILKKEFTEAAVLPVPDDAPLEVPRIVLSSINEHSQLIIFKNSVSFQTNFSEDFQEDWSKCIDYLNNKLETIITFVDLLTDGNYDYFGLIVEGVLKKYQENGSEQISNKLLNNGKISNPHDIQIRYTFKKEDFFINIGIQNVRIFNSEISGNKPGEMNSKFQEKNAVGITIDINDRYGYNTNPEYKTSHDKIQRIMIMMKEHVEWKVEKIIEEGEYSEC